MTAIKLAMPCLLCTLIQACSTPTNHASAKCMEQADLAYVNKSGSAGVSPDCVDNRADGKPSNAPSNTMLETAALQAVVSILDSSTN